MEKATAEIAAVEDAAVRSPESHYPENLSPESPCPENSSRVREAPPGPSRVATTGRSALRTVARRTQENRETTTPASKTKTKKKPTKTKPKPPRAGDDS